MQHQAEREAGEGLELYSLFLPFVDMLSETQSNEETTYSLLVLKNQACKELLNDNGRIKCFETGSGFWLALVGVYHTRTFSLV